MHAGIPVLAIVLLTGGCGVIFRGMDRNVSSPVYVSVIQDSRTIGRVWQGESWIPGLDSPPTSWGYYCFWGPTATVIYLVDMPFCLVADTILLPFDLWHASNRPTSDEPKKH